MDSHVQRSLLYDFYGHLLTERQRELFYLYDEEDLSLGEIAERLGVSRQAVYDILKRAERSLERYESNLGLVARHMERRDRLFGVRRDVRTLLSKVERLSAEELRGELERLEKALSEMV